MRRANCDLIGGPYHAPAVQIRERTVCLFRDCEVVVTSWTNAPVSWPRCRSLHHQGGGSGLLVTEELFRAIRTESGIALKYWFGVSDHTVWSWRRAFGVTQWGTEGSRQLFRKVVKAAVASTRGTKQSAEFVRRRMQTRKERGVRPPRFRTNSWKKEELVLLGTMPDAEVAREIGKTANAVRIRRTRLGIPTARDRRRRK